MYSQKYFFLPIYSFSISRHFSWCLHGFETHHDQCIFIQIFKSCSLLEIFFHICFSIHMKIRRRQTIFETMFGTFHIKSVQGAFWTRRDVHHSVDIFAVMFIFHSKNQLTNNDFKRKKFKTLKKYCAIKNRNRT